MPQTFFLLGIICCVWTWPRGHLLLKNIRCVCEHAASFLFCCFFYVGTCRRRFFCEKYVLRVSVAEGAFFWEVEYNTTLDFVYKIRHIFSSFFQHFSKIQFLIFLKSPTKTYNPKYCHSCANYQKYRKITIPPEIIITLSLRGQCFIFWCVTWSTIRG